MKWSETIRFNRPLQQVSLLTAAPAQGWEELLRAREEAGYQRGRREAESALQQQLTLQREEMAQLQRGVLESLRGAQAQVVKETETGLISLALEAARRVVADTPISADLVEAVVREALRQAEDNADVTIQLHPNDLELLRKHDSTLLRGLPDTGPLRIVTSPEVTRGGCLVQTRFGLIDARREVKLEQLAETLSA
jgi:flagellar assembly protein FliH